MRLVEEWEWYWLNDAEVKPWDVSQLAAECFGGEAASGRLDASSDRLMDISFEKVTAYSNRRGFG